jgi:hypothetical protein
MVLISIIAIYAAICVVAWLAADSMSFFPQYASRLDPRRSRRFVSENRTQVTLVHLPKSDGKFAVWYFHGNAESRADISPRIEELRRFGISAFAMEYPGYATSDGTPTESEIFRSLGLGLRFLQDDLKVLPRKLVIYGRSLGSGPAVEIAARQRARVDPGKRVYERLPSDDSVARARG